MRKQDKIAVKECNYNAVCINALWLEQFLDKELHELEVV